MMRFNRPAVPAAFTTRVGAIVAGTAKERDLWREYKTHFLRAQHERCGYCDCRLDKSSHPDIDHYRPQSRLDKLNDPEAEAKCCREIAPRVEEEFSTGYDWLRYDWDNYVYACKGCNETFKRCLFPVEDGTRTLPLDPTRTGDEEPLLLWCYGKEYPANHLEFAQSGAIAVKNNSAHGLATILTCGLSRRFLQDARSEKLTRASEVLDRLELAKFYGDGIEFADCIEKLKCTGAENRNLAGVFRIFVMGKLGATSWDDVIALTL